MRLVHWENSGKPNTATTLRVLNTAVDLIVHGHGVGAWYGHRWNSSKAISMQEGLTMKVRVVIQMPHINSEGVELYN